MANTVLLKRSNTANSIPLVGDLTAGELAINTTDGNLFYKNNAGIVTLLVSNQLVSVTGNITGGNVLTSGLISVTGNIISAGNISANYYTGNGSLLTGVVATDVGTLASLSVTGNIVTGNLNTAGQLSATGNISGANIIASGTFYGDGSGLTGVSTTDIGGYFNSTFIRFPTGDFGNLVGGSDINYLVDPFGVSIVPYFTCMDPEGNIPPAQDLGVLV